MNPIYTGKDVSFIDTKQAQRIAENTLLAAEKFATIASLLGARYPSEAIDKAWRQLLFGAHHDGITGSESDQVYLDLLGGWREALELGSVALDGALAHLGGRIDTTGDGQPLAVFNPLSWERSDICRADVALPAGTTGLRLTDDAGSQVLPGRGHRSQHRRRHHPRTPGVPGGGCSGHRLPPLPRASRAGPAGRVRLDVGRGHRHRQRGVGDRGRRRPRRRHHPPARSDRGPGALRRGETGNELRCYREYPMHPHFGRAHGTSFPTAPTGRRSNFPAEVTLEESALGRRIRVAGDVPGVPQDAGDHPLGRPGPHRLCHAVGRLHRAGPPLPSPFRGGRGWRHARLRNRQRRRRPRFRLPERGRGQRRASHWTTPPTTGSAWAPPRGRARRHSAAPQDRARRARSASRRSWPGVPPTRTPPSARSSWRSRGRESRRPSAATTAAGTARWTSIRTCPTSGFRSDDRRRAALRRACCARPAPRTPPSSTASSRAVAGLACGCRQPSRWPKPGRPMRMCADTRTSHAWSWRAPTRAPRSSRSRRWSRTWATRSSAWSSLARLDGSTGAVEDYTVAILNRGIPSFNVESDGSMYLSVMRSCSGWPSGVWINPPRRSAPDGSNFQFQHWSHTFDYALVGSQGDWRAARAVQAGTTFNNPLLARVLDAHGGDLPGGHQLCESSIPRRRS